jgi:hypothetical protein
VPSGLTAAQYNKERAREQAVKDKRYSKNGAKAGNFLGYVCGPPPPHPHPPPPLTPARPQDEFYLKRGTDLKAGWKSDVTLGHRMTKTKCVRAKRGRRSIPGWGFDDDI